MVPSLVQEGILEASSDEEQGNPEAESDEEQGNPEAESDEEQGNPEAELDEEQGIPEAESDEEQGISEAESDETLDTDWEDQYDSDELNKTCSWPNTEDELDWEGNPPVKGDQ